MGMTCSYVVAVNTFFGTISQAEGNIFRTTSIGSSTRFIIMWKPAVFARKVPIKFEDTWNCFKRSAQANVQVCHETEDYHNESRLHQSPRNKQQRAITFVVLIRSRGREAMNRLLLCRAQNCAKDEYGQLNPSASINKTNLELSSVLIKDWRFR